MKNQLIKFYGLLGLSEPVLEDKVTGKVVSFKLNPSEKEAIFYKMDDNEMKDTIVEALLYFREDEKVFYKDSRWTNSAILRDLNSHKILSQCQSEYTNEIAA